MPDRRLLLVHAHPDDECINNGATMARYVDEGVGVTLVTCTAGEMGEVLVPDLSHLSYDEKGGLGDHRRRRPGQFRSGLGRRAVRRRRHRAEAPAGRHQHPAGRLPRRRGDGCGPVGLGPRLRRRLGVGRGHRAADRDERLRDLADGRDQRRRAVGVRERGPGDEGAECDGQALLLACTVRAARSLGGFGHCRDCQTPFPLANPGRYVAIPTREIMSEECALIGSQLLHLPSLSQTLSLSQDATSLAKQAACSRQASTLRPWQET